LKFAVVGVSPEALHRTKGAMIDRRTASIPATASDGGFWYGEVNRAQSADIFRPARMSDFGTFAERQFLFFG
tara:strand:- start:656 stop:871 length:216 start_codon:yes stop_codon:yes gene_type:complete